MIISMTKDIFIDLPLVNQKTDTKDKKWANKSCGVCSLKMVLEFINPRHKKLKIMGLIKMGLLKNGYIKNIGWKHNALVELADNCGVKMRFQKKFLKMPAEKRKGLAFIEKNIENNKPVIVSVFYNLDPRNGGHLVVVRGFRSSGGRILGYHIQDPDPSKRGHNHFVAKKEFLKGWRGGMIWLE